MVHKSKYGKRKSRKSKRHGKHHRKRGHKSSGGFQRRVLNVVRSHELIKTNTISNSYTLAGYTFETGRAMFSMHGANSGANYCFTPWPAPNVPTST